MKNKRPVLSNQIYYLIEPLVVLLKDNPGSAVRIAKEQIQVYDH